MTFPTFLTADSLWRKTGTDRTLIPDDVKHPCAWYAVIGGTLATDLIAFIASIVVVILGALSILSLPPIGTYSLIGLASVIALFYSVLLAKAFCCTN